MKIVLIRIISILILIFQFYSCSKNEQESPIIEIEQEEKIFNGSIVFETQDQLEEFALNKYNKIIGNITVGGVAVTNSESLNTLKFIDGQIHIYGTSLKNLDGFSNINFINEGYISIVNNPDLENIDGVQNISARLLGLDCRLNPKIKNIDGFKNISQVTNMIDISENENLTNLNGLANINQYVKYLTLHDNILLTNTTGLANIPKISDFSFVGNHSVASLENMSALVELNRLTIDGNNNLQNIDGLKNLKICYDLLIRNNPLLENLDGLVKLEKVSDYQMHILNNLTLKDFCGLSLVSTIYSMEYAFDNNGYNPTKEDIINGSCKI